MKINHTFLLVILSLTFAQYSVAQPMTARDWAEQARTNIRLLPRYGDLSKTTDQKAADQKFIATTMEQPEFNNNHRAASDHMIELGFVYLGKNDHKTAMYRFNQAYLLDSSNTNIYWGYGAFFMSIGMTQFALKQYQEGLELNPNNTHLLTDYATYFIGQYYEMADTNMEDALSNLEAAVLFLDKSITLDSDNETTNFKLSICHWIKGDCDSAWVYYNRCKELGGQTITEAFTNDLNLKCPRKGKKSDG